MTTKLLPVSKEVALETLRRMYLARYSDEKMQKLVRQNKGGTFHLSVLGHEMIGAVSGMSLKKGTDWGLPYYRDRSFVIGLGGEIDELFASFLARAIPTHSSARQMPEHFSSKELRIPCQSSVVGSQYLQAVGLAKGLSNLGQEEVVYVSGGDGSTSQGDFHEALNYAAIHKLGVVFVIQDNGWAISVRPHEQTAGGSIGQMVQGYTGLDVHTIDGTEYLETQEALSQAVSRARSGEGPSLIVASIPRIGPHSSSDDPTKYKEEEDPRRDPIPKFENWLLEMGLATEDEIATLRDEVIAEIEEAAVRADALPFPKPETVDQGVFAEASTEAIASQESGGEPIVMVDALNAALHEEMEKDESVVVFGQDVAHGKGGVFGVTRNLTEAFGEKRCFNTPLAESTIVGTAIGMGFTGEIKPVAEIQFCDYMWTGINQIINELSSIYYRSNGTWKCPIVIRMPYGGYIQGGPYHSQAVEAYLAHTPGLKVVIPSNSEDAKRLLKGAIRDPNPVIFLEHKALYRQRLFSAKPDPGPDAVLPLGQAKVIQEGDDVTLIGWGMTAAMGFEAAQMLAKESVSVEVIDLMTIVPLDMETILTSVRKTGKVLICHEAAEMGGFGAEIAAQIASHAFEYLDAPIERLCGKNCPVPYSKVLEEAHLPNREVLAKRLSALASF